MWLLSSWLSTAAAQTAVDCSVGDAPSSYTSAPCNGNCYVDPGITDILICFPFGTISGDPILVFLVEDYPQNGDRTYSGWGTNGNGDDFCCFTDDESTRDITQVVVTTGENDDEASLTYLGRNVEFPDALVSTGDGDDYIEGSDATSCDEVLNGDDDIDTIVGNSGGDTINGGADGDDLAGGPGEDTIHGNAGADTIGGGNNDDTLFGDNGNDFIEGGDGDDTIEGGDLDDILRGHNGNDTLIGNDGADVLCGGPTSGAGQDTLHAGASSGVENPGSVDQLWELATSNTPAGTAQLGGSCGHSGAHGNFPGITCSLTGAPTGCP